MTSNVGETGVESIRLKGMKVEELPLAFAAHVAPQIKLAEDTERQNKIGNILKRYPTQRVDYLDGRIQECKDNQGNMANLIQQEQTRITEYQGHIAMCEHRDRMLAKLDPERDKDEIAELKKDFPPYDVEAMKTQIRLSNESIERAQRVTAQESDAISEMSEVRALCQQRDAELAQLGVRPATGNNGVTIRHHDG